jgi:hypothetical protein
MVFHHIGEASFDITLMENFQVAGSFKGIQSHGFPALLT